MYTFHVASLLTKKLSKSHVLTSKLGLCFSTKISEKRKWNISVGDTVLIYVSIQEIYFKWLLKRVIHWYALIQMVIKDLNTRILDYSSKTRHIYNLMRGIRFFCIRLRFNSKTLIIQNVTVWIKKTCPIDGIKLCCKRFLYLFTKEQEQ